ncbi:bifunctional phosphopantothenoylcysteine decarboxylase/phosphopantothenate synthase [Diaminobutyricibacter tongyongensis]|uniref:Coenzyme A biosynthesis bifunctional protein CoaBC n=1 Tax=Leifsonia tongyongensis TaxID=1268043 RepID=A0A6L9XXY3_9MICO|nr:bifunctional phosphopantothenoylcysteine decarboxylase/phosphopantothenate synthase [Diaminobutyricibacter tongyongensis]NEN06289.1 bifunctional phosphopantothenoylcysteine decarboxylase/phosphopantothenate synthase [Diaminobutyricibacter tongyongensis]
MTIVVGITGGIAAYKAVGVIRALVLQGHSVHVVATEAALRFVGRPTLEAISRNPVATDLYEGVAEVRHVAIGQSADLIVIAPATANTIAKLAVGLADDLLGNTVLASTAPLVIAPAMHTEMWQNPATVANIATLRSRGVTIVGPAVGQLTGKDSGPGRMEEPDTIVRAALAAIEGGATRDAAAPAVAAATAPGQPATVVSLSERRRAGEFVRPARGGDDLAGRRIVITAGGTREPLDPVRFLGNRSSGRQGIALAVAAKARGADVTLIAAHLEVAPPEGVRLIEVGTANELQDAVTEAARSADIVVMAAAVADYRPAVVRSDKIKKTDAGDRLTLELVANPDVLKGLAAAKRDGQTIVGFAAETEQDPSALVELGRSKLEAKGSDFLILNQVGWSHGFATESNEIVVLKRGGDIVMEASGTKLSVADRILDVIA